MVISTIPSWAIYRNLYENTDPGRCIIMVFSLLCRYAHRRLVGTTGAIVKAACLESLRSRVRAPLFPSSFKEAQCFFPTRKMIQYCGDLRDREVACSASDHQGSNFESCIWRTVSSSHSSHHPQVFLAKFSLYEHKGGLKTHSFHFTQEHMRLLLAHPCIVKRVIKGGHGFVNN